MNSRALVLSIAGAQLVAGMSLQAQQPRQLPPGAARPAVMVVQPTTGTWVRGPGTYTVTVCDDGCTIVGPSGKAVDVTVEAWAGGGGGAAGTQWTRAGGGGGGGAYATTKTSVTVPHNGTLTLQVIVGAGGSPGLMLYGVSSQSGQSGGTSKVTSALGGMVEASGGRGGGVGSVTSGGAGGLTPLGFGTGPNMRAGQVGGAGADPDTCNGGGGGGGGMGGGPEALTNGGLAINNGGNGGHGSYQHRIIPGKSCTAHGTGYGRTDGFAGGNGRIKISW